MTVEIHPEPTPEQREALLRAVDTLNGRQAVAAWWEAGIRDAVADVDDGQFPSDESPPGLSPAG